MTLCPDRSSLQAAKVSYELVQGLTQNDAIVIKVKLVTLGFFLFSVLSLLLQPMYLSLSCVSLFSGHFAFGFSLHVPVKFE